MNRLLLNKLFLLILLLGISFSIYSQHGSVNLSSKRSVKKYLEGDWYKTNTYDNENYSLEKTVKYTFGFMRKYKYSGFWTQEHANSTAEIMKLKLIKDTVNIELYDILGDYSYYKIKTLNNKELVLVNDRGEESLYFRE